jgi:phage terminase small subunit
MTALIYQLFGLDASVEIVLTTGLEAYDSMNEAKALVKKYDMVIKNPKTGTIHKNPALDQIEISRRSGGG